MKARKKKERETYSHLKVRYKTDSNKTESFESKKERRKRIIRRRIIRKYK